MVVPFRSGIFQPLGPCNFVLRAKGYNRKQGVGPRGELGLTLRLRGKDKLETSKKEKKRSRNCPFWREFLQLSFRRAFECIISLGVYKKNQQDSYS